MTPFVVIEASGRQYCVREGSRIKIDVSAECAEGSQVSFDKVLLFDDGEKTDLGAPYLEGRVVTGVVEKVGREKKISVIRFRAKSNYKKHYGHRQPFCQVRVTGIA